MLFTFEDALQIHHAKCEKIEVYKLANVRRLRFINWQTRRKHGPVLA